MLKIVVFEDEINKAIRVVEAIRAALDHNKSFVDVSWLVISTNPNGCFMINDAAKQEINVEYFCVNSSNPKGAHDRIRDLIEETESSDENSLALALDFNYEGVQEIDDLYTRNIWDDLLDKFECKAVLFITKFNTAGAFSSIEGVFNASPLMPVGNRESIEDKSKDMINYLMRCACRCEEMFWPEHAKDWFRYGRTMVSSIGDVPHDFNEPGKNGFLQVYRTDIERWDSPLGRYLRKIVKSGTAPVDEDESKAMDLVESLLLKGQFFDMLKNFVGSFSVFGSGDYRPTTSCFMLPLIASVGQKVKFEEHFKFLNSRFSWVDITPKKPGVDLHTSSSHTRRIICTALDVFRALSDKYISVSTYEGKCFDYFSIIFSINGVLSVDVNSLEKGGKRQPLLSCTQYGVKDTGGDFIRTYETFQTACTPPQGGDRVVYSWFLPTDDAQNVELRIGVAKRC